MKKSILPIAAFAALAAVADPADPRISNVSVSQDPVSRRVTVTYGLDEDAVVTMDVMTNHVSIGGQNINHVYGDCNRIVQAGSAKTFYWRPEKSWPGQRIDEEIVSIKVTAWAKDAPPDYMVVDLVNGATRYYPAQEFLPNGGVTADIYKTELLVMRKIPSGGVEWRMGSPEGEPGRWRHAANTGVPQAAETPLYVTLSNDFYIGVYEFTQRQAEIVRGSRYGSYFKNADCYRMRPVEYVCVNDLLSDSGLVAKLRTVSGNSGFTLPLEAEWEFACRAGTMTGLYSGKEIAADQVKDANVDPLGRYYHNGGYVYDSSTGTYSEPDMNTCTTDAGTAVVGSYQPNGYGLYDMYGNVAEFCRENYIADRTDVDPNAGYVGGDQVTARGGGWKSISADCRSASRYPHSADWGASRSLTDMGFRVSCPAKAVR